jgi:hypothetical protein
MRSFLHSMAFLWATGSLLFLSGLSVQTVWAQAETSSDSLSGFEESGGFKSFHIDLAAIDTEADEPSFYSFGGFVKEELGYSYEHEADQIKISKIRTTVNLKAELRFLEDWKFKAVWNGTYDDAYRQAGRDKFSQEILDTYESEFEIRDCYIDGSITDWVRFKIGRQIIAWGEAEGEQIIDVANPRDMRELGMVDLEDARIPVTATQLTLFKGMWTLNLAAVHEIRGHKLPAAGSEFDLFASLRGGMIELEEEELPESKPENTEYLARLFKSFNGGDICLVWADVYDDAPYLEFSAYDPLQGRLRLVPRHQRYQMVGLAANRVFGSWLFKTEVAQKSGKAFPRSSENLIAQLLSGTLPPQTWSEKDTRQLMVGCEYSGLSHLTLSLEGTGERILEYDENLAGNELSGMITAGLSHSAWNDTLNSRLYWIRMSGNNGDVVRFSVGYNVIDALNVTGGVVVYAASDPEAEVYPFRQNDRLIAELKYSF